MNTISRSYFELIESLKSDLSVRANQMLSDPGPKTGYVDEPGDISGEGKLGMAGLSGLELRPFMSYDDEPPVGLDKGVSNIGSNKFDEVRKIFGNLKDRHRDG